MYVYVCVFVLIKDGCTLSLKFNGGSLFFAFNDALEKGVLQMGNGECLYEYQYIHICNIFK